MKVAQICSREVKHQKDKPLKVTYMLCSVYLPFRVLWVVPTQLPKTGANKRKVKELGIRQICCSTQELRSLGK